MRTRTIATLIALAAAAGPLACDKKEEKAEAPKVEPSKKGAEKTEPSKDGPKAAPTDEKKAAVAPSEPDDDFSGAAPAATGLLALPTLGLAGQGASDARVSEALTGDGVTVLGATLMATVETASDDRPKTEPEAKKNAEATYTAGIRNWKAEALPDGFAATFENEGDLGVNYFVNVRRELGGKAYWCATTVASAEEQAAALAFCKSLSVKA